MFSSKIIFGTLGYMHMPFNVHGKPSKFFNFN